MKKGFTMIELIFVIVILGILAAVAIPRLAATRDDAEIVKASTNLNTLISDIGAYYTSQGKFATKLQDMTNVLIEGTENLKGELLAAGKKCIKVTLAEAENANSDQPATLKVEGGTDETDNICSKVLASSGVKKYINYKTTYKGREIDGIAISGIGIQF